MLSVPKRGKPPAAPEGYEQFPGNPYKFWPKLPPCEYRIEEVRGNPNCCGGNYNYLGCKVIDDCVTRLDCRNCKGNPEFISTPQRSGSIFLKGHHGIGDNIYQRPFIKAALRKWSEVHLESPWPQVYNDIEGVQFVKMTSHLRTQRQNITEHIDRFGNRPTGVNKKTFMYTVAGYKNGKGILQQFADILPVAKIDFDWNIAGETDLKNPYVLVHFPTLRKEWLNTSRNCKPEYIQDCVDWLKKDFKIISIAANQGRQEYFVEDPKNCDEEYHEREKKIEDIVTLVRGASMVVAPVGFLLPMGWSIGTKTFIIFGGGQHPDLLTHPDIEQQNLRCVTPDPFCQCNRNDHNCFKDIDRDYLKQSLFDLLGGSNG